MINDWLANQGYFTEAGVPSALHIIILAFLFLVNIPQLSSDAVRLAHSIKMQSDKPRDKTNGAEGSFHAWLKNST